jgi:hypothetical protein
VYTRVPGNGPADSRGATSHSGRQLPRLGETSFKIFKIDGVAQIWGPFRSFTDYL